MFLASARFDSQWIDFGLGLFQNMFHNLLMYSSNFCFGYVDLSCFFENFPVGCQVGWLENLILMKSNSEVLA